MRALIIDDSGTARAQLRKALEPLEGWTLDDADSGPAALARLAAGDRYDVLFVDYYMPEMDGLALIAAVRRDPAQNDVRLMMVTSETELTQVARSLDAGADEYLMKPFTPEMVAEKLQLLGLVKA